MKQPVRIAPERAWRSYRGGRLIAALHGENAEDTHFPEEWIMSTVQARNHGREHIVEGLSRLTDTGETLRDFIARDPEGVLGEGRTETGVLMKLIDAAERLAVQVHPTRADAMRLFASPFGKTECWHILGGRTVNGELPHIYFGFREGVTRARWAELFYAQDVPGMLDCLHRIEVRPGETYLISGGVPHAIGAGCFLAEIQEPTDITLRVERTGPNGTLLPDVNCHQGIGYENMLDCFNYDSCDRDETLRRWRIEPRVIAEREGQYRAEELLGYGNTPFFRLEKRVVWDSMTIAPSDVYHGFYVLEGRGSADGQPLGPGVQYFVPAGCGYTLHAQPGDALTLLVYEGPQR